MKLFLILSSLVLAAYAQEATPSPAQATDFGRVAFSTRVPEVRKVERPTGSEKSAG